jgi:hypothetical protein
MKTKAPGNETSVLSKLTTLSKVSMVLLALTLFTTVASAAFRLNPASSVYVVSLTQNGPQFGAVNLANGSFTPIGPTAPVNLANLVWWRGELLSLAASDPYAGYLVRINPANGAITPIGPTGQGFNAFDLAEVNGKLYLTDFQNNFYSINPFNGAATLIAATGMPPDPNIPFTLNPDGTFNLCDESLYSVGGRLYATFDSFNIDEVSLAIDENPANASVAPALYRIDPSTGKATRIGPTDLGIGATVALDGRFYAFEAPVTGFVDGFPVGGSELYELNLANGKTTFIHAIDPAAGPIFGAAPVLPFL